MTVIVRILFCAALFAAAAPPALGRDRKAERAARELAQLRTDGEAAIAKQDFAAAARAYQELYRRTLQPEGLYRLGVLANAEGRLLDAQDLMRRFLSDPRFDPAESVVEVATAKRILALPRPPSGKVIVIGERGILLSVDGRLVGALPLSRPLLCAVGKRKFTVEDGRQRQEEELDVSEGRFVELTYDRKSAALLSAELAAALVLEKYDGLPPAVAEKLTQVVEDALQGDGLSPFPREVALERAGLSRTSSCVETAACQVKIARQNELEYVLNLQFVKRALDAAAPWELRLGLIDAEVGGEAARSEKECASCDQEKAIALLRSELPRLLAEARGRQRGELSVTSTPAGAEVRIGTRLLGTTPLVQASWAGSFEVAVALAGYEPQQLTAAVKAGEKNALAVKLLEIPEPAPPPLIKPPPVYRLVRKPRPRWRLALGGAAVVGGALLATFGISGLAVADSCRVEAEPPAEACRERFGTTGIGAGLLGAGGALLVTGGVLLAIPGPRRLVEVQEAP